MKMKFKKKELKCVARKINELSKEKGVSREAIAIAWLLKHPAKIQPVIGTRNPERIKSICEANKIELTREEWYHLYLSNRIEPLP